MDQVPVIDRETINMLREMDAVTEDGDLILELVDEFLTHSTMLVTEIKMYAQQNVAEKLATTAHSLKGACLNIGALVLFQVCDRIEEMARNQDLVETKAQLATLNDAFLTTTKTLTELRERTSRGESIEHLLG